MRSCPTCGMAVIGNASTCARCQTAVPPILAPQNVHETQTTPQAVPAAAPTPAPAATWPSPPQAPGPAWPPAPPGVAPGTAGVPPPGLSPPAGSAPPAIPGFGPPGLAPPPQPDLEEGFFGGAITPRPFDPRTAVSATRSERKKGMSGGAVLGILVAVIAAVAAVVLVPKFLANTGPQAGLAIGESGFVVDKPAGWSSSSFNDMAANLGYISEGEAPGTDLEGIRAFAKGDAALGVAVIAFPPGMQTQVEQGLLGQGGAGMGRAAQTYQHELGPAVDFDASEFGDTSRMTIIVVDDVLVMGVVLDESGSIADDDIADYQSMIESLRRPGTT